jgi:ubiquinone biosynthesis protein COQ4
LSRVRACKEGRVLLADKPVVDDSSRELRELMRLPRGTFGREYAEWTRLRGFEPGAGPPTRTEPENGRPETDPDARYVCERIIQVHDFWHVLTGYNSDEDGELGLLAFSFGQTGSREIAHHLRAFVLAEIRFAWRTGDREWRHRLDYLWHAWRRGRKARFLVAVELENYFILPLDSVRQRLGIDPAAEAYSKHSLPPIAVPA